MLDVRNLEVAIGNTPIIRDVSFRLEGHDILVLVGPTGCGKTTLLRTIAGLVPPSAGEIQLGSRRITPRNNVPPEKRRVGMVFQDFALFPHLTVLQNVSFRLKDQKLALDWIERLGLTPVRDAMPERLSGGQKQRVALARALAHQPELMLLDEPLSNLDAALKDSLRWDIREALAEAGVPAIWVTHDQEEALSIGDYMGVLNEGRLEQLDTPERCFSMPASRFAARFLGEAAFVRGQLRDDQVETPLGTAAARPSASVDGEVELLVRPDDLSLAPAEAGNGEVVWSRYEGETRLYAVSVGGGAPLRVRTNHEVDLARGTPVRLGISAHHPLTVFLVEDARA